MKEVSSMLNQIFGGKNNKELNSVLTEQTKEVIYSRLSLNNIEIDKENKGINPLKILEQQISKNEILAQNFSETLYYYLLYTCKQVNESVSTRLNPIEIELFKLQSLKEKKTYLKSSIERMDEPLLNQLQQLIIRMSTSSDHIHGSIFDEGTFGLLDKKSQKSVALYALATELLIQHPEYLTKNRHEFMKKLKITLKDLINKIQQIRHEKSIVSDLTYHGMSAVMYMIGKAYVEENDLATIDEITSKFNEMYTEDVSMLQELHKYFGHNNPQKNKQHVRIFGEENIESGSIENDAISDYNAKVLTTAMDENQNKIIIPHKVEKKFQLPFNTISNNIQLGDLLESGKEVTESSYKMLFQIADKFLQKVDIQTDKNYSLLSIKTKEILSEVINGGKTWTIQHERDLSQTQGVTEHMIDSIAKIIHADQETFTLHSREYKLYLKGFKKPFPQGRADYYGYFQNNMGVEGMHLLLYRNKDRLKERKMVFNSGENLGIHDHLYYYIQINYYLKYQKILPKEVVYANLYHELNQVQSNGSLYDISIYKKQYKQFIESIIWPFSKESLTSNSRTIQDHIVFAGLAGTGKSQFMQTLLTQKEYVYNNKTLTLNAIVMSININEFLAMITQNNYFIQRIYKNTGLPIILVIEDLDTILSDEAEAGNSVVQAITNFLQGVGETPITLITSTNFLHRFPQRIIRPGRFNKIIGFDLELTNEEFTGIIRQHISNNKLKEPKIREELLEKNKHRMKHFSAAYLAKVIQNIAAHYDFQAFNKIKNGEKEGLLNTILDTMIIPLEDINHANTQYKETMKKVTAQLRAPIGYTNK